jgi:rhamnosyl/mannosyltransferase
MRFLVEHPDTAVEMGCRARARYEKLFTADRMAQSYVRLYDEVLSERGGIAH